MVGLGGTEMGDSFDFEICDGCGRRSDLGQIWKACWESNVGDCW